MSMMRYRPHRGGLSESLAETVEIERSKPALISLLQEHYAAHIRANLMSPIDEQMVHLTSRGFDYRCGWDEYLVTLDGWGVCGMTDGPCHDDWRPILTAPRDGTDVQLKGTHPSFGDWELQDTFWVGETWDGKWYHIGPDHVPTHWKPREAAE